MVRARITAGCLRVALMQSLQTKDAVAAAAQRRRHASPAPPLPTLQSAPSFPFAERRVLWPLCGKRCDTLNWRDMRCEGDVAFHPKFAGARKKLAIDEIDGTAISNQTISSLLPSSGTTVN
jgi:hypothetical protein